MKKYILPLILILCLIFSLNVFGADLFGTYDQRIKLTIDNTKIDATLTWFPVTVLLTSTAGEEIFIEFDADADFDKVAFTTSDGSTQLYADCELFDDSAQKAIYHVSKTGWEIASGADTDFYMYYDDAASSNDTYISKSGNTAAQSVYDGNFKAVYHMNDVVIDYDTKYEATVEPDSDGWALSGTDYATSDGDILTIDTTGDSTGQCYYYKAPDVNFDNGFYYRIRVQIHSDTPSSGFLQIIFRDGTQDEQTIINIFDGRIKHRTSVGSYTTYTETTNDTYHVYEIYVLGTNSSLYMDGVLLGTETVEGTSVNDLVQFGDTNAISDYTLECMIDYIYYALDINQNPVNSTIDSTSNLNTGTKKAANEPIEAIGKVGRGQDFDGSDDFVMVADNATLDITAQLTLEAIIYPAAIDASPVVIAKDDGTTRSYYLSRFTDQKVAIRCNGLTDTFLLSDACPTEDDYHHLAGVYDSAKQKLYLDGTNIKEQETTGSITSTATDLCIGSMTPEVASRNWYDGKIDEVRISATGRAAAWIKATYNSLWDTLLTYGSEETEEEEANAIFFGTDF